MKSVYEIKRSLEEIYDIPFQVEIHPGPEPGYTIRPDMEGKGFFDINVEFRNHVRMIMTFQPQAYSAPFIVGMGVKSIEAKLRASEFARFLIEEGCTVDFRINGLNFNAAETETWPEVKWERVSIKITKAPFEIEENQDYGDLVLKYGRLVLGMVLSLSDIVPVEESSLGFKEGAEKVSESKRYERNRLNRELCLKKKGYKCSVCGFDFEEFYGPVGKNFIHVHHVVPVSQIGADYIINPVTDLTPVCPNCHAMLHRKDPPFLPEELKKIIETELLLKHEK